MSLKSSTIETHRVRMLQNGGFERAGNHGRTVDVSQARNFPVPAYSGRVFLYAPATTDELGKAGPQLTVVTAPGLGEVRFPRGRVRLLDILRPLGHRVHVGPGIRYFSITFDKPGKHVVEVIDVAAADMKTPAGYGSGETAGPIHGSLESHPAEPRPEVSFPQLDRSGSVPPAPHRGRRSRNTRITAEFEVEKK